MNKGYEDTSRNRPKWPFIIIIIIIIIIIVIIIIILLRNC